MQNKIHRAKLLQPYSELTPGEIWAINLLVEENPDPSPADVQKAINTLIKKIISVFPNANVMMDIRISISSAAADVAHSLSHLPPFQKQSEARRLVDRWFKGNPGQGSNKKGASPDDGDTPDAPQRTISRKGRQVDDER